MEKKTKLWLGTGLVALAAYLLWKSKQANATQVVASTPASATTPTATSNMVGFSTGEFFKPENEKFKNASANAMQVPASKEFFKTGDGKFNVEGKWAKYDGGMINSTNVKGAKLGSHNAGIFANQPFNVDAKSLVSKKMSFAPKAGPVLKQFAAEQGNVQKNADGKFFEPHTAPYGQNQGVFAPAPNKMLVGSDGSKVSASNKAMMGFSSKIWA